MRDLTTPPNRPLLQIDGLQMSFDLSGHWFGRFLSGGRRRILRAVDRVSLEIHRGATFSIVGESGCGKSTVARCVVGLYRPTGGTIRFDGVDIANLTDRRESLPFRRRMQMVFQDPYSSLNPRWRAERIIAEPILTHEPHTSREERRARVMALLEQVGLAPQDWAKYPHEFSGGQRQRLSIARALASRPDFIVCDEPTSALDVSVQAQILNLMMDLQRELSLTYLFISHALAVVKHVSDHVAVMYLGRFVEWGAADTVLARPHHPYTQMLLDTVPKVDDPDRNREPLAGEVPNPLDPPHGCAFHPRCPIARDVCRAAVPSPTAANGRMVACHAVEHGWWAEFDQPGAVPGPSRPPEKRSRPTVLVEDGPVDRIKKTKSGGGTVS